LLKKYKQIVAFLKHAKTVGLSKTQASLTYGGYEDYFYDYIRKGAKVALNKNEINEKQYDCLISLYSDLDRRVREITGTDTSENEAIETDKKQYGRYVRNEDGVITHYEYAVFNNVGQLISGVISLNDMETLHAMYSAEGNNQSRRSVSRHFLGKWGVDYYTFEKILLAFDITKSSIPIAPHTLEMYDVDSAIDKVFQNKELLFTKKLEEQKIKRLYQKNEELMNENFQLKRKGRLFREAVQDINWNRVDPFYIDDIGGCINGKTLVVLLADIHIGAMVEKDSLFENNYDADEVTKRFKKIIDKIRDFHSTFGDFRNIVVVNLGDALDGLNNQTTRGGHFLPQNMSGKTQFLFYVDLIKNFVHTLYTEEWSHKVSFYSVEGANHDGFGGWAANNLLVEYFKVKYPKMDCAVFQKAIDWINLGEHTLLFFHGKDSENMFKNYPLYLDDKTENKINQILDEYLGDEIYKKRITFIKADLHMSGVSYGKRFEYKSCPSILGSTKWSGINFGETRAAVEFLIFDQTKKDEMFETRLVLN
jgi:hypothetical protein